MAQLLLAIRRRWMFSACALALTLTALACGNAPVRPDTQATVRAFYATITAQAGSGQPLATQPAETDVAAVETPSITPSLSPTPPESRTGNGTPFTVPRCQGTLTVDGAAEDWSQTPDNSILLNTATFGLEEWQGIDDLSGTARLCWTDAALYLTADVTDDLHVQTESAFRSWRGDEMEVMFDADLRGDFYENEANEDDTHIGLNTGNFDSIPPHAVQYVPSLGEDIGAVVAVRRAVDTGANYVLEASIPWGVMRITPQAGMRYGLCVAVSDNDHVNTAQQDTMVSHCTELATANPMTWVTVTLD